VTFGTIEPAVVVSRLTTLTLVEDTKMRGAWKILRFLAIGYRFSEDNGGLLLHYAVW